MRIDKFLKVSRIIKRRTVANEACDAGRVSINGKVCKASAEIKCGDIVEIRFGERLIKVRMLPQIVMEIISSYLLMLRLYTVLTVSTT